MPIAELITGNNSNLYEDTIKHFLENRILILNQEIDDSLIEEIIMHIINWNIEDIGLPVEKRRRIILIINSCGGDVFTGFNLCNVIETSNTPIYGVAMGLTASCAYYIYLSCHKRYAYKNSVLLQHDGSVSVCNSTGKVRDFMEFNTNMEQRTKDFVLSHTSMEEEFYDKCFEKELYLYADRAMELGIVDGIIGDKITFEEIFE